jgi:lysine-specific demethylase 9
LKKKILLNLAWHLRLRQYYPGQEVINEQTDPNLAETPHYKEKQTILPNPITIDHITGEKKLTTPLKRSHDGRPKKPSKFPESPHPVDHSDGVLLTDKKSDEAKIDMRKLIIEPKHRKRSSSSSGHKVHSSSSSSHSCSKDKHRGSSDHHRSSSKSSKHRDEHRKSSSNHSSSSNKSKQSPTDVRHGQEYQQQPLLSSTSTTQSIVSVPAESIIIEHPMELNAINNVPPDYNDHLKAIICPPEPTTEQIIEIETVTSPPQLMDMMSMDSIIEVSSTTEPEPELVESIIIDETRIASNVIQSEQEFVSTMTHTPPQLLTPGTPKIKKTILKTPSSVSKPHPDLLSSILAGMDSNNPSGSSTF